MIACYHTHTKRCHHAIGDDEQYVLRAIERGVKLIGFSDHAPMPYPDGYVSYYKMGENEIGEYFSTLLALREKYADKIEIKIGFETEYYPDLWDACLKYWSDYPIDYLILGQHFLSGEGYIPNVKYSGYLTNDVSALSTYVDRVISAINTDKISYVAHPDLLNFEGDGEIYKREMTRLIKEANRLEIPLEINLLGLSEGRAYPRADFWTLAGELGARAVIGCDAHEPDRVARESEILAAYDYAARYGVKVLEKVTLRPVL